MTEFEMPPRGQADPESDGWPPIKKPEPVSLDLPTFPSNLLPTCIGGMVEQTAAAIQAPVDIAGMLALPVAASTLAGKVQFTGRADHHEHAMLWTLTVAASSERKTPVFNRLREPLNEVSRRHAEQARVDDEVRATELEMVETQIKKLRDAATKAAVDLGRSGLSDQVRAELAGLVEQRQKLCVVPPKPCVWATSPTPEGLHGVMAANGGRVAVFSDEGGLVGTLAGRYSGKDGADMDPFLSGYVGSPLKTPRATSDRKDVDAAYLTMGLAVQSSVLDDLGSVKGAEDRGLVGRFLFALAGSLVGTRMYGDSTPIEDHVADAYARALTDWAVWNGNVDGTPVRIGLTAQAYKAYEKFHDSIEVRQREGGDLHDVGVVSKIAGTTLRVAGLFHCFDVGRLRALEMQVSEDAVLRAVELANGFFIPHGLAALAQFRNAGPSGVEGRILSWVLAGERREFRLRQVTRALMGKRGSVQKSGDVMEPLANLIEDGYLREGKSARSDSHVYHANPALFGGAQ